MHAHIYMVKISNLVQKVMLLRSNCALKLKFLDFSADSNHEPDSNCDEYTGATLEAGDLPESFTICSAFMEDAWTIKFVSAIMFTILANRKGSWGSINLVVSPYYTQCKVRLDHGRFAHTVYGMFFPLQWTHVYLSEAANLTLVNLVKDGKLVVDGKLLQ